MQRRLWSTNGLFVGAATLLTMGSTALAKPADMKAIVLNGGTAGLSALGIVIWGGRRNNQTQLMLRQEMRSHLQTAIDTSWGLKTGEFNQKIQPLHQGLNNLEQVQTELNQVNDHLKVQLQEIRDRVRCLEQELTTVKTLQQQVQDLQERRNQTNSNHSPPVLTPRTTSAQPHSTTGIAKPIKKSQVIEQFGSKQEETVIRWLEQRQIRLASTLPPIQQVDDHYNQLALYLGDHYAILKELHNHMKRALHKPDEKRNHFWFESSNDEHFRICTKFCKELQRAFLVEGDFRAKPGRKFLKGKLAEDGILRAFLDGKWFERFVYQKMAQILTDKGLDHACLLNAQLLSAAGRTEAELDMVFLIEGQPICIECKSGQYQQEDARKFAQYAEKLELAKPCAIFVVLEDCATDIELQKPQMGTITMTTSAQLVSALEAALHSMEATAPETNEESDVAVEAKVNTAASKVLNQVKSKYRSINPRRAAVWQGLTTLFDSKQPQDILSFVVLKSTLAERVGISKNQINGVLLLLRNAGYFRDEQDSPVMSVGQPIHSLRSQNPADAEQTFVEEYVRNILKIDWDFFDEVTQCQQFAAMVGATMPDETTLERLKQELSEGEDEFNSED